MVEVQLPGTPICYYVYKRPHLDYFLAKVAEWFNLVVFTASVAEYADPVIDWLDSSRTLFTKRYFRPDCTPVGNGYVKDLSLVEKDLSKVSSGNLQREEIACEHEQPTRFADILPITNQLQHNSRAKTNSQRLMIDRRCDAHTLTMHHTTTLVKPKPIHQPK